MTIAIASYWVAYSFVRNGLFHVFFMCPDGDRSLKIRLAWLRGWGSNTYELFTRDSTPIKIDIHFEPTIF